MPVEIESLPAENGCQLVEARNKRVLVVDDDEDTCALLAMMLQKEGFRIETAFDGQDALTKIKRSAPDMIILDVMLPRCGGYEVLRALQQGVLSGIPVLMITGRTIDRTTFEMFLQEPNVVEFLRKPIRPIPLAMCLHRTLRTKPSAD